MNLSETPHGYKRIVPLDKTFRLRLPEAGEAPRFCHTLHAIPISASEFPPAMRDYPIVFVRRAGEFEYTPMIILGLRERQNLFVMGDGVIKGEGPTQAMLDSKDPYVRQFLHAEPDGPVHFHYPARPFAEELALSPP